VYNSRHTAVGWPLGPYSSSSDVELIQVCAQANDGAAWEEFVARFLRPITLSIIRTAYKWGGFPQQVVEDLVQDTFLKLCSDKGRLLRDFASQHPAAITGYIKTTAVNVAHDHFKSRYSLKRGSGEATQLREGFEPEARSESHGGQRAIEREILLKQIDRCLEICTQGPEQERDRLIFWLHYQHGMSARAIAELPTVGLTAKGVESAIVRLTRVVREHIVDLRSEVSDSPKRGEKDFAPPNRIERRT
jgi:RNA polymerase sigma-70 factor (ECF subfamily)